MSLASRVFATAVAFGLSFAACRGAEPAHRPFSEMHGGCEDFAFEVSRELLLLGGEASKAFPARRAQGGRESSVVKDRAYRIQLWPSSLVRPSVPASDTGKPPPERAGYFTFTPSASGRYRLSLSRKLWVDVLDAGEVLEAAAFEMQTGCETLFKSVDYHLTGGRPVLVYLGGSGRAEFRLVLSVAGQ